jgi:predicted nucleic acid-binding protein
MNDRIFLDTNVILYCYSSSEPLKREIAQTLIIKNNTFLSTQVLQELCNVLTKKLKQSYQQAEKIVKECSLNNSVSVNSLTTVINACKIAERYKFSFYDSLIIAAALESNCSILYSEDLHNGQLINGSLRIVNPFKTETLT